MTESSNAQRENNTYRLSCSLEGVSFPVSHTKSLTTSKKVTMVDIDLRTSRAWEDFDNVHEGVGECERVGGFNSNGPCSRDVRQRPLSVHPLVQV